MRDLLNVNATCFSSVLPNVKLGALGCSQMQNCLLQSAPIWKYCCSKVLQNENFSDPEIAPDLKFSVASLKTSAQWQKSALMELKPQLCRKSHVLNTRYTSLSAYILLHCFFLAYFLTFWDKQMHSQCVWQWNSHGKWGWGIKWLCKRTLVMNLVD